MGLFAAICLDPVSYTHLDVYKRQQFYLVWPGLLLVAAIVAARRSPTSLRRLVPPLAVAIGAASGVYAAWLASTDPNVAYFSSLTRGWELALGCLLAVLPAPRGSERLRTALSWLGLAGIAASVIVVDADAPFMGCLLYTSRCV